MSARFSNRAIARVAATAAPAVLVCTRSIGGLLLLISP